MNKFKAIVMKAKDNVATVTENIAAGTEIAVNKDGETVKLHVQENIPFGHKVAIKDIAKDSQIIKYGEVIGVATKDIAAGQHTHVHNLVGCRGRGDLETGVEK
ncbi:UxaA family hydrolase [Sporomusa acidovorans]|uniref:Altronate dehydratase n=1 Tax=Sporomusa acidovorans (strain ATCC 49682 / DSM 3132 / Mol) TaxID=1123286 RepID=A0ABZ3J9H8_SPOA4|nr:UxaA family hydrolase [Sporomusa acidovorans]OZC17525.1 altronate dehydratase [Sporomusa acidovorans DSM 3132]SDF08388.1 altronate dehydratase small subunit [Sporomusa acidovorans]